jgi:hypothetical protein
VVRKDSKKMGKKIKEIENDIYKLKPNLFSRFEELEKGIEKHRINTYRRLFHPMTIEDFELYKLIKTRQVGG